MNTKSYIFLQTNSLIQFNIVIHILTEYHQKWIKILRNNILKYTIIKQIHMIFINGTNNALDSNYDENVIYHRKNVILRKIYLLLNSIPNLSLVWSILNSFFKPFWKNKMHCSLVLPVKLMYLLLTNILKDILTECIYTNKFWKNTGITYLIETI